MGKLSKMVSIISLIGAFCAPAAFAAGNSITLMGSTALQPLAEQAAKTFMEKKPEARVLVQGGGSGTGLTQVAQGGADIGNSDIFAEEKADINAKQLVDHKVCVVGFATAVNPKVTVTSLTQQQLIDIFSGKVTNWKEVGGNDQKIVIINRPKSSGTRATFKKYALKGTEEASGLSLTEDSSGTVRKTIAETPGAVGYLALSYIDPSIKALEFNGVAATVANITDGKYPVWSYEHMYTKGEPSGVAKEFLGYMMGPEVQGKLVAALGYIPVSEMKTSR
ncbi:MAG: phosphate ABC transporter substrate-binding protein [Desulfobacteraceae bacterium]|nr:phosphate ABC transporter substrate-binding protein [Desulfobacteraceae bacterium]